MSRRHTGIGGLAVATITPFQRGGWDIDYSYIEKQLEMLQREGAQGIVPVGTNGEFPSLTLKEKKKVLEVAASARGNLFLIAGCGSCSLPETLELVNFATDIGAAAALVVPPYFYKDVDTAGVIDFYRRVLGNTQLPILLYNIPVYSGVAISNQVIEALMEYQNLIGVKDTGGDLKRTRDLVERYPDLVIFGGSDSQLDTALKVGCAGMISGAANAFPRLVREIWDAHQDGGDVTAAGDKLRAVRKMLKAYPWVAATKCAVSLRGLPETFVRPPLIDLTKAQKRDLKARLSALGLI